MSAVPNLLRAPRGSAEIAARRREIDAVADQLRRAHWDQFSLPLSAQRLAEGAGVSVRARGGADEPTYPYRGRLLRLDGRPVIEVSLALDPLQRRLVLAHALGHHLLDHGEVPPELAAHFTTACPSVIEQEANHFALDLLLPGPALRRVMDAGWLTLKKLSRGFLVPEDAVQRRLLDIDDRSRL